MCSKTGGIHFLGNEKHQDEWKDATDSHPGQLFKNGQYVTMITPIEASLLLHAIEH